VTGRAIDKVPEPPGNGSRARGAAVVAVGYLAVISDASLTGEVFRNDFRSGPWRIKGLIIS